MIHLENNNANHRTECVKNMKPFLIAKYNEGNNSENKAAFIMAKC